MPVVRGEKCVRGARNVEQLFVFFFLLRSSTDRNRQVPRGIVGSSTISNEGLAVQISVTPFSLFHLWFFFLFEVAVETAENF